VVALGAGADQGVLLCAAAMAVAVAALVGLTAADYTGGTRGRALRWALRVLAVGLVACGVLLTLDGVMSV
jgi:hypothetical protein